MKTNSYSMLGKKSILAGLVALPLAFNVTRADIFTWADPGASGTWNTTNLSLWTVTDESDAQVPAVRVPGAGDTVIINSNGADPLNIIFAVSSEQFAWLIGSGVTVDLRNATRVNFTTSGSIVNHGVLQVTTKPNGMSGVMLSGNTAGSDRFFVRNTGTIQITGADTLLTLNASVDNTGGLFQVTNSGTFDTTLFNLTGGELRIAANSTMMHSNVQAPGDVNLTNVTISNAGVWEWSSGTTGGSRAKQAVISGGALNNSGTLRLTQRGDSGQPSNNERKLSITVKDGATLTNSGRLSINIATADTRPRDEWALLDLTASAGALNNSGLITITNAAANEDNLNNGAYVQFARLTVGHGNFTNTGTISISVAGAADRAFHGATLNINGGVISASGAGEILAAATVLNSGAVWEINDLGTDVLNLSGDLTVSGAALSLSGNIDAGHWLLASAAGNFAGLDTLNLSALPGGDFVYELDYLTDPRKLYLNISSIPEPSAWALLLGGGAALWLSLRRRRSVEK